MHCHLCGCRVGTAAAAAWGALLPPPVRRISRRPAGGAPVRPAAAGSPPAVPCGAVCQPDPRGTASAACRCALRAQPPRRRWATCGPCASQAAARLATQQSEPVPARFERTGPGSGLLRDGWARCALLALAATRSAPSQRARSSFAHQRASRRSQRCSTRRCRQRSAGFLPVPCLHWRVDACSLQRQRQRLAQPSARARSAAQRLCSGSLRRGAAHTQSTS